MSNSITDFLAAILSAKYGEQVRGAIHDAIELCYQDGKAGVNDLEARHLIEQVIGVNEMQEAGIETLTARVEALEQGGEGESAGTTTTTVPTFIVDHGIANFSNVQANKTATMNVTFAKTFTEAPVVAAIKVFRNGPNTFYSLVTAQPVESSITTTGFTLAVGNRYTQAVSPSVLWIAFQPTEIEINTEIIVPSGDGMTEAEVTELLAPISAALNGIKTGYDGTVYSTPGEAVREQINDLHVLIGHVPGQAIDASAVAYNDSNVAAELADVNGRLVDKNGTDEVTPKNLQILEKEFSSNLINMDAATDGKYITADGVEHNGNYFVTDFIPVEAGANYCGKYLYTNATSGNSILYDLNIRYIACYDANKTVMPSAGKNTATTTYPYIVPDGVAYVRLSITNNSTFSQYQFEKGNVATAYIPYGEVVSAKIKNEYIPPVNIGNIPAFELVEGQNLLNKEDADYLTGKYINSWGNINNSDAYIASGYIKVNAGDTLFGSYLTANGKTEPAVLAYIACYDANKSALQPLGKNANTTPYFEVPETVEYVRVSIRIASYTQYLQIEKTNSNLPKPYKPYEAPHYEILDSYTPQGEPPLHVYLPSELYVAVGRTIELYNELVCIDYEKYHFRWVCAEGAAYKRKFSITGITVKNLNLDLYLYDDEQNVCWCGRCVVHVVAASNPTKKILPIGDSLTNWKAWLQETMLLSGNNITFVGTRYSGQSVDSEGNTYASGTIHHEGRSGFSASDYLANTSYTFDNRYDGVSSISGSANPFWDGSKFSLNHYLTTQTGVTMPDAVQIFLGTNDIRNGIDPATANIVSMVQTIRDEYPDMPIFVCNTIYNSNQNGYGSVGSDAYSGGSGASAYQYEQDCLVMGLMKGLKTALSGMTKVYIIPLATCMDREYNFGQVMTKVNPRSDVEIPMPVERIHPQAVGYYQMADLMYSFYCGLLS